MDLIELDWTLLLKFSWQSIIQCQGHEFVSLGTFVVIKCELWNKLFWIKNICHCICQCIKAGKQLGLAFVYNICHSPSRDNHFFISFLLSLPQVNSLSSHSFLVKFQPMSPSSTIILRYFTDKFSEMSADTAVSTLNSTLTLALDALWPLVLFLFVKIYFSVQTLLQ